MKDIYRFRRIDLGLYSIEKWNGHKWLYLQQIKDRQGLLKNIIQVYALTWTNMEDELTSVKVTTL